MDRPASRGLLAGGVQKAPTGLSIERPERPSTASRQQGTTTNSNNSSMPPSTAQRPIGTANSRALGPPGTAFRRVLQSGGAQTAVQAQARPMTQQQGMGGLKPTTAGVGRQVLDRTYFINELRQKRQQIVAVIGQMQEDLEVLDQKKAAAARADKMVTQLKKEVRLLQEALADNNIIIDKAGSQAPLQHIHAEFADIKSRNEAQQARVEDILSQRLALEQQAKQVDVQISTIQTAQEQRLNSLAPSARQAYNDLLAEQAALLAEAGRFEEEGAELGAALNAAEGQLSRSGFKQRVLEVQEQIRVLTQRKVELAAAEAAAQAPPEEQREALMSRIKRDNAAVEQMTAEAKALQAKVKQLEARQPAGGGTAAGPAADDPARRAKYDELRGKERELTAFIDAFPQRRAAKQQELTAKQEAIVKLLQHLTDMQQGTAGGTAGAAAGADGPPGCTATASQSVMQSRVSLGAAAAAALSAGGPPGLPGGVHSKGDEVSAKRAELQKLEELEGKIRVELAALREQLAGLQAEVQTYTDVDGAKRSKEAAREDLEQQQHALQTQQSTLKAELADQKWQQQTKEALLKEHPAWPAIDRLEQQLKQVHQHSDRAREFIKSHEDRANYTPLVPQLESLVQTINTANIAAAVSGGA